MSLATKETKQVGDLLRLGCSGLSGNSLDLCLGFCKAQTGILLSMELDSR